MVRHTLKIVALAGMMAVGSPAVAVDFYTPLSEEVVSSLNDEARSLYRQAYERFDKADLVNGMQLLADAAQAQPDNADLQIYTIARATDRASVYYSATSFTQPPEGMDYSSPPWRTAEKYYDMAEACLARLIENTNLTTEQRRRLLRETAAVEEGRQNLSARDEARMETGQILTSEIFINRLQERGILAEFPEIASALGLLAQQELVIEQQDVIAGEDQEDVFDPLSTLPGEVVAPWNPAPPPQQGGPGAAGGAGGFGRGGAGGFGADGAGGFGRGRGAAPGANPFGGGGGQPGGGAGGAGGGGGNDPFGGGGGGGAQDPFA